MHVSHAEKLICKRSIGLGSTECIASYLILLACTITHANRVGKKPDVSPHGNLVQLVGLVHFILVQLRLRLILVQGHL